MKEALLYLIDIIRWRFSKSQYIGKRVNYRGRFRKVIGETYRYIIIEGFEKRPVNKKNYLPYSALYLRRSTSKESN